MGDDVTGGEEQRVTGTERIEGEKVGGAGRSRDRHAVSEVIV
jgi:hypothetical protein